MKTNGPARHWRVSALALMASILVGLPVLAQEGPPAALKVQPSIDATGVRLDVRASGPFEYTTLRPSETLYVVEMTGVSLEGSGAPRVLNSDVVSGYRLLPYRANGRPAVRMEVLLRRPAGPRVERKSGNDLVVSFDAVQPVVAPAAVEPVASAPSKPVTSSAVAHSGDAAKIERVTLTQANGQVLVHVGASGKLNYQAVRLINPERLVLDFQNASAARVQKPASLVAPVAGIRTSQFKAETARVVIDLQHSAPYQLSADASGLTITLGSVVAKAEPVVPQPQVSQSASPAHVELVAAKTTPEPAAAPVAAAEKPMFSAPAVMVDSGSMPLPKSLTGDSASLASPRADDHAAPAATVTASGAPSAPRAATPVAEAVDPGQAVAAGASSPAPQQATKKYTGEPISVNLKDVDLKDFFRLIHEISGLNVVLDPTVQGRLTLVLDDVPWDQALDIVLQNNGLDNQLQGNVLRIATRETLRREAEQTRDLAKAQNEAVPSITATRRLSYAKASAVTLTLKRFLSSRGDILADDRANLLIIRDIPSVFPDLDALIKQLDRKSQQVEIEARVVSASRTFSREIGVQFGISSSATGGRNLFGGLPGNPLFVSPIVRGPALPVPPVTVAGSTAIPLVSNLPALNPNTGFSYAFSSTNVAVDLIISAAESRGVGKLLSKPKVVTQNNQKATVKQGTKIPVQTVINNTISTEFIDAVLRLEVTPQITEEGTIYMDVDVENTQIDPGIPRVQGIPALDTQETQTKVLVTDGGTVVIGGVIVSSQQTSVDQTPFFGSIPVIGHLFRHTSVTTTSQELLFFITPRIIPS